MGQKLPVKAAILAGTLALVGASWAVGAPPQVPALPTELAEYFKYAVTDLPNHYKIASVTAQDNTPVDNPITDSGATLGRVLFYDKRLSHNDGVSCGSCHRQEDGFSDPNQVSTGINGLTGDRHSPGLTNAKFYDNGRFFWDERAATLEEQALGPIENPVEMGSSLPVVIAKLQATQFYPVLFQAAFGTPEITSQKIGKAIAQFERSMVSYQAKYDTAFAEDCSTCIPDFPSVFNAQELLGEQLFHGAGKCSLCHATNAHVGDAARNIGLDLDSTEDPGVVNGKFKTPSLRNVEKREWFMHDGRFTTLEEVIQFYSTGIQNNPFLDNRLKTSPTGVPLVFNWTQAQKDGLVAYLRTLTDNVFLNDVKFSDPFVDLPGDYSGNGEVGPEDYDVWRMHYGDTTLLIADGNNDLVVDAADYTVWRNNFGKTWLDLAFGGGGGGLADAVPEPGALLMALTVIASFASVRRNRRHQ